jgi:hypothetical protein
LGSLVNPSGWEKVESVEIFCPSYFRSFEIRRDSVEALLVGNEDENPGDAGVQAVQG